MLESLSPTCEGNDCDRQLQADHRQLIYESPGGTRHVYECDCGAVTITLVR